MPEQYFRLISKYAIILAVFLIIENFYSSYLVDLVVDTKQNTTLRIISTTGLGLLLNVIMALIINADINRLQIKTKYVTIVTILSKLIGVIAFLLFAIFDKDKLDNGLNKN
jgi:hypothetical protein